mmetsp:Transcript_59703/g.69780  ORF Transcript_59703/g.69780 Transcript_59703/m.69780 type:complete len:1008 (+) Transcript_59703:194-3217(+)
MGGFYQSVASRRIMKKHVSSEFPNGQFLRFGVLVICAVVALNITPTVIAFIPDRSRVVQKRVDSGAQSRHRDNGIPIEGGGYRSLMRNGSGKVQADAVKEMKSEHKRKETIKSDNARKRRERRINRPLTADAPVEVIIPENLTVDEKNSIRIGNTDKDSLPNYSEEPEFMRRRLGSQLTGCCYTYGDYAAEDMCGLYGVDCEGGGDGKNEDDEEGDCSQDGLSFIGISFSVNTEDGNPYSYQLCDQFAMESIIDRDYDYVMSMDEDGWLVGGGYKTFDYSGKMPYIDSSHTELVRIGSLDVDKGGTSIAQVYEAMSSVYFAPLNIYPEYLKGGGGHHSGDEDEGDGQVESCDVTLVVSVVEEYDDNQNYSEYEYFLDQLFSALEDVNGGPCMDDRDTDPHVSMVRGLKFKSSYAQYNYMYSSNLEVAVWQAMYPNGVPIGSKSYAAFPPGGSSKREYVGYGNLYFFFDRANITSAFNPNRDLTDDESYYATLYSSGGSDTFYSSVTSVDENMYAGSNDNNDNGDWEHNPYNWKSSYAQHDMTDGWDLPPNCNQEGETFFGIPLSMTSDSKLQSTSSFQSQFDFENIIDRNYTYIESFGTNHGWLVGESIGNGAGSIVDKDTAHIPLFYMGTTNPNMGGMSLSNMIAIAKKIEFGALYIKPAFVFIDESGHLVMQFEADATSAIGYLYDSFCKQVGISWNYETPSNNVGSYTNCAMHAAGDRAAYGCGPDNSNTGGFCPRMTIAYSVEFQSEDHSAAYIQQANNYVDYWRSLYPTGVAVGTNKFCKDGGCLGLFLNRYDLYFVFKPDLGGSWVEYNGASAAPTFSPAPTWTGGCDDPHNFHLDKCFRKRFHPRQSAVAWDSLGEVGQLSVFLVTFMAATLSISIFLARARKRRRKGESYFAFFVRDLTRKRKKIWKKKKKKKSRRKKAADLEESMLGDDGASRKSKRSHKSSRSRSKSKSGRSSSRSRRSRSKSRSKSRMHDSDRNNDSGRPDDKQVGQMDPAQHKLV